MKTPIFGLSDLLDSSDLLGVFGFLVELLDVPSLFSETNQISL